MHGGGAYVKGEKLHLAVETNPEGKIAFVYERLDLFHAMGGIIHLKVKKGTWTRNLSNRSSLTKNATRKVINLSETTITAIDKQSYKDQFTSESKLSKGESEFVHLVDSKKPPFMCIL